MSFYFFCSQKEIQERYRMGLSKLGFLVRTQYTERMRPFSILDEWKEKRNRQLFQTNSKCSIYPDHKCSRTNKTFTLWILDKDREKLLLRIHASEFNASSTYGYQAFFRMIGLICTTHIQTCTLFICSLWTLVRYVSFLYDSVIWLTLKK